MNAGYAYNDVAGLRSILITSAKANATIFVTWEHDYLVKIVQSIMNAYGGGAAVPAWTSGDYDALYVVRVNYGSMGPTTRFERDREGLNGRLNDLPVTGDRVSRRCLRLCCDTLCLSFPSGRVRAVRTSSSDRR